MQDENYDGWYLANTPDRGICVWDESKWGKSTAGYITIVFNTDDIRKTYDELLAKGLQIEPPRTADWGGQELVFPDPDDNMVMLL